MATAEAGFLAGKSYLKDHCQQGKVFPSLLSTPANPRSLPVAFLPEGEALQKAGGSFRVTAGNNADDPGFGDSADTDGILIVVVTGRGPLGDEVTLEARVESTKCPAEILVGNFSIQRTP
jgi:hypothetical protein